MRLSGAPTGSKSFLDSRSTQTEPPTTTACAHGARSPNSTLDTWARPKKRGLPISPGELSALRWAEMDVRAGLPTPLVQAQESVPECVELVPEIRPIW